MGSPTKPAASAARPITASETKQLLSLVQTIKRDLALRTSSLAARHRMTMQIVQLTRVVAELGAVEQLGDHTRAMTRAVTDKAWDDGVRACEAFELAAEGKAPAPIATAPIAPAPAADRADDPDQAHGVPDRAQPRSKPVRVLIAGAIDGAGKRRVMEAAARSQREPVKIEPLIEAAAPAIVADVATVEQLGEAVRLARTHAGLTQQQAATAAGVGRRFVVELEGGKASAEVGRVLAVCRAVGLALAASAA